MKKLIYSLAFASMFAFGSCDNLELAPEDFSAAGSFWKEEGQVSSYMNGLHGQLRGDYTSPFVLGEVRGETIKNGTSSMNVSLDYARIATNKIDKDNTGISNWNGYYSRILQLNHFIMSVEEGCEFLSAAQRGTYLGQAYGLRAYYYFNLYRTFGGVPIEVEGDKLLGGSIQVDQLYMARAGAEEVLNQIKSDINASESNFGSSSTFDCYYWSKYSTLMLKAQIYLWSAKVSTNGTAGNHTASGSADLQVAKTALQGIISSGKFSLQDSFKSIFDYGNKKNSEIILSLYFHKDESTNDGTWFIPQSMLYLGSIYDEDGNLYEGDPMDMAGSGYGRYEYKENFVKSFDKTDSRRGDTFVEYYTTANPADRVFGNGMMKRHGHIESGVRYFDSDVVMMRYADVLLMMAEVENGLGGSCAPYINQIRQRAYGENFDASVTYVDGSYAENELAILKERDKEFVSEGCRWYDIVRLHDANKQPLAFSPEANYDNDGTPILDKAIQSHMLLWPVNVGTLTGDPLLKQTPGY